MPFVQVIIVDLFSLFFRYHHPIKLNAIVSLIKQILELNLLYLLACIVILSFFDQMNEEIFDAESNSFRAWLTFVDVYETHNCNMQMRISSTDAKDEIR